MAPLRRKTLEGAHVRRGTPCSTAGSWNRCRDAAAPVS